VNPGPIVQFNLPTAETPWPVDLVRQGQHRAGLYHEGRRAFTLLLAPDKFDFNQPDQSGANGQVFGAALTDLKKLCEGRRDNDRTMVYAPRSRSNYKKA
jgi:hypothetical protein